MRGIRVACVHLCAARMAMVLCTPKKTTPPDRSGARSIETYKTAIADCECDAV